MKYIVSHELPIGALYPVPDLPPRHAGPESMMADRMHCAIDALLPDRLEKGLRGELPGAAARQSYAPQLSYGRHEAPPPWNARQASVMVLLYRHDGQWHVPLTRRPDSLSVHSGQVSFPGGEIERQETPEQAATRELAEELGVAPADFRMLGRL